MSGSDEQVTPGTLHALKGEGDTVTKLDLIISYLRELYGAQREMLKRLQDGDERMRDHSDDIIDLKAKVGNKKKPEPNWWARAVAIALLTSLSQVVLFFILKGGLASGIGP